VFKDCICNPTNLAISQLGDLAQPRFIGLLAHTNKNINEQKKFACFIANFLFFLGYPQFDKTDTPLLAPLKTGN